MRCCRCRPGWDLDETLRRIVQGAMDLVGAGYGALAVLGHDGMLSRFIPVGVDRPTEELIGPAPDRAGVSGW